MPYMLLVHEQSIEKDHWSEAEAQPRYERMMAFARDLEQRGLLIAAESLLSDAHAVRIAKRGGKTSVTDGPFAEAREVVGGFFLLRCDTREDALAIAHECPAAEWSTLEIRPVGPCRDASA